MTGRQPSPSLPAIALREQSGDRRPPEITRKITACVACRKQKIKCHMNDGNPPCSRCKKRGLPCAVNKSLQTILESDADWKHTIEGKVKRLESLLTNVGTRFKMPDLITVEADEVDEDDVEAGPSRLSTDAAMVVHESPQGHDIPSSSTQQQHHWEIVMDPDTGPGTIPGSVVNEVESAPPTLGTDLPVVWDDMITRGALTFEEAQAYFDIYQKRLNCFLYSILPRSWSLARVRTSPLLFAAICAVGSLHQPASIFDKCYQEFVKLASQVSFASRNTTDDVRALCIGAFWLSGISWRCSGAAVRIATELQLQRSITKALAGDRPHYLRTRLYYLVYVCDHHFSVPYGRPPMTCTDESIRASLRFLKSQHAIGIEDDARLVAQVQSWIVGSDAYEELGIDVERPLDGSRLAHLRRLGIRYDNVRADYREATAQTSFEGSCAKHGVALHYHFSKLFLLSHAFWGISSPEFRTQDVALEIDELVSAAVLSATTTLRFIVEDKVLQGLLNGLPTYFDLMIAFAVVFLLKVSTKYTDYVRVNTRDICELISDLVVVLKKVTSSMHPRHVLANVAHGTETLLSKCFPREAYDTSMQSGGGLNAPVDQAAVFDQGLQDMATDFATGDYDNFFMGNYDFLSTQEPVHFQQDYDQYQTSMP